MREIKFRAWDGRKMFNIDVLAISPVSWSSNGTGVSLTYQPSIKVMQFTGLKDKNGKEIYERDILKTWHGNIAEIKYGEFQNQECLNADDQFYFDNDGDDRSDIGYYVDIEDECLALDNMAYKWCEVVGNIHENPELLEPK
jgi:uncharacterized phage protein (TIGR01671 family)